MMRSLFAGVAGLKNHQTRMDVIGNNVANVNTTGFKGSRVTFQDMLSQTLTAAASPQANRGGTNPQQIGLGVGLSSIDTIFTDGSVQSTGKNTDLCISGNGFFVMSDGQKDYYTRNGAFEFDKQGNYVLPGSGLHVKGWMADGNGNISTSGPLQNIVVPAGQTMPAKITTGTVAKGNLSAIEKTPTTEDKTGIMTQPGEDCPTKGKVIIAADGTETTVTSVPVYEGGYWTTAIDINNSMGQYTMRIQNVNVTPAPVLGDPITVGGQVIGKVSAVNGTSVEFETTPGLLTSQPKGVASINGNAIGTIDSTPLKDTNIKTPAAGDKIYDKNGVEIGTVTKVSANGKSFEYLTNSLFKAAPGQAYFKDANNNFVTFGPVNGTPIEKAVYSYDATVKTPGAIQTMSFAAYDSQGIKHVITGNLTKTATNTWEFIPKALADTGAVVTGEPIKVSFDKNGKCISGKGSIMVTPIDPPLGSTNINMTVDFSALTQYDGETTVNMASDGNSAGTLDTVSVDSSGMIVGGFSNGLKRNLGQVALATFNNPAGLMKEGSSLYSQSNNSGDVQISTAGAGGAGSLTPAAIEMSNVNLSDQFSDMIITQRGFQSNSKIITVSDEMLETLVNMKR